MRVRLQKRRPSLIRISSFLLSLVLLLSCAMPLQTQASSMSAFPTEDPEVAVRYEWKSYDKKYNFWIEFPINRDTYLFVADFDRELDPEKYSSQYIQDPHSKEVVEGVVGCFKDLAESFGYENAYMVREMTHFVQTTIKSANDLKTKDQDDYPRYPMETLYERKGDSQDRSILLAAMIKELGYDAAILKIDNHYAVAIRTDPDYRDGLYYQVGDARWLYIETTSKQYKIGQIPKKYQDKEACFYFC